MLKLGAELRFLPLNDTVCTLSAARMLKLGAELRFLPLNDTVCALSAARMLKLRAELRFLLLSSRADVDPEEQKPADAVSAQGFSLAVTASRRRKCPRRRRRDDSVGRDAQHLELCRRCCGNVYGQDEESRHRANIFECRSRGNVYGQDEERRHA